MAIFAATLLLAGVATSCNKKCECKTYVAGVVTTTTEMELDKGKKITRPSSRKTRKRATNANPNFSNQSLMSPAAALRVKGLFLFLQT